MATETTEETEKRVRGMIVDWLYCKAFEQRFFPERASLVSGLARDLSGPTPLQDLLHGETFENPEETNLRREIVNETVTELEKLIQTLREGV